jgi:hypothetical protein
MGLFLFWAGLLCGHVYPSCIEKCYYNQWVVIAHVVKWLLLGFEEGMVVDKICDGWR